MYKKQIESSEIEQIVKFIELKRYELMNSGHHESELVLLLPRWLYFLIQKYYSDFFKTELPSNFFGMNHYFHYKNEVVVYNYVNPEYGVFVKEIIFKEEEKEQSSCKPIKE